MATSDPYDRLSPAAVAIVDQLVDVVHDGEDPLEAGIEWYSPDEEPPVDALEELERAGICVVEREGLSVVARFTAEGSLRHP